MDIDGETVTECPDALKCTPLKKMGNFNIEEEDPGVLSDQNPMVEIRKQWPDAIYKSQTEEPTIPIEAETETPISESMTNEFLEVHHMYTRLLAKLGVDACARYKQSKVENIILGLSKEDVNCSICSKVYSSRQHLRNHMQKRHLGKTHYECNICNKFYTDSSSLKQHKDRKHQDLETRQFPCTSCNKRFISSSQLAVHAISHQGSTFHCQFCDKSYKYEKGLKEHLGLCRENPEASKKKQHNCRLCGLSYTVRRSLL